MISKDTNLVFSIYLIAAKKVKVRIPLSCTDLIGLFMLYYGYLSNLHLFSHVFQIVLPIVNVSNSVKKPYV